MIGAPGRKKEPGYRQKNHGLFIALYVHKPRILSVTIVKI